MRAPHSYAVAVRRPDGQIVSKGERLPSLAEQYPILKLPVLRGSVVLIQSMILGIKSLNFSASVVFHEAQKEATVSEVELKGAALAASVVTGSSVAVAATATDDVAVAGVQFLLDGAPLGAEVTQAPYAASWDTTGASRSVHTLAARARDAANNQTTSAIVTVTLADPPVDTTAPTVTATPPPGTFTGPQSVVLVPSEQPVAIYYTLDGGAPATSSLQYAAPIAIATTKTLRYLAVDAAGNSSTGSLLYTIASPAPSPAPTVTAPAPSIVNHSTLTTTAVPVTLSSSTSSG